METVYLICFFLGTGFAIVSALLGGVFDSHADAGGHIDASGHDTGGHHFPLLSPVTICTFLSVFGGTGIIITKWVAPEASVGLHLSLAALSGLAVAAGVGAIFYVLFIRTQTSSALQYDKVLGIEAKVTTSIPREGLGEITYVYNGITFSAPAKIENQEKDVRQGEIVAIRKVVGHIFYVEPKEK